MTTVDLFEEIPGARVLRSGLSRVVSLVGYRAMSLVYKPDEDPYNKPCFPTVWIDGLLFASAKNEQPAYIDDLVDPSDIAGMEVYQSAARIPVQFNIGGTCGVIVIWTR